MRKGAWDKKTAQDAIAAAAKQFFPGLTVSKSRGVYRGGPEEATVGIEILRTSFDRMGCDELQRRARCLAGVLRRVLRQQSVLIAVLDHRHAEPFTTDSISARTRMKCSVATVKRAETAARRALG